ncbi:MAG: DNA mismatch repair protein [Candidatus Marinimicrobia bacterium]|nr:DNA mismatch repair protein [Candidatus Neomarinimicrobiota bacterium]
MIIKKTYVSSLRIARKIHRTSGALLFIFFFIIAITGLLLGWKKNSNGLILPQSQKGASTELKDWLPLDTLQSIAFKTLIDSIDKNINLDLQRIDARPDKGMVKFVFNNHYWGIQLDGSTGDILAITKRRSDFFENIHDGSILDIIFGTKGEIIKLIYTTIMGIALLIFTITGFWLWYGPKLIKKNR